MTRPQRPTMAGRGPSCVCMQYMMYCTSASASFRCLPELRLTSSFASRENLTRGSTLTSRQTSRPCFDSASFWKPKEAEATNLAFTGSSGPASMCVSCVINPSRSHSLTDQASLVNSPSHLHCLHQSSRRALRQPRSKMHETILAENTTTRLLRGRKCLSGPNAGASGSRVQRGIPMRRLVPAVMVHMSTSQPGYRRTRGSGLAQASVTADGISQDSSPADDTLKRVVLPTALVLLLCNVDRICMSVAILPISKELSWSPSVQGIVQSAFLWGYTVTQIAGGALADQYGGKVVIAYALAWFSLASLLLPAALHKQVVTAGWALPAVLLARAAVGFGEGVVLPAMSNLMATCVPTSWRATALGIVYSGFHSGNPTGLFLSPLIMAAFGWRAIFYICGALGLPLLLAWLALVPARSASGHTSPVSTSQSGNEPLATGASASGKMAARAAGLESATSLGVKQRISPFDLMSKPATWAIIIVNIVNHWGYFIYLSWMPSYFHKVQGLDLRSSSLYAFIPWLALAACSSVAGVLADRWLARGAEVATVRKRLQSVAFLVPAAMLLVLVQPHLPAGVAVAAMTVALGATSVSQFVANMSDIAPKYAGQLFGICNTFGCLAAILGVSAVGFIFEKTGSFDAVFQLTAALYVLAVAAWNILCSGKVEFE